MRCIDIAAPGGPEVLRIATKPRPAAGHRGGAGPGAGGRGQSRRPAAAARALSPSARRFPHPWHGGFRAHRRARRRHNLALAGGRRRLRPARRRRVCRILRRPRRPVHGCAAGVSIRDAAAIPEAAITVWANLFEPRRLFPGNLFLVQGGSSGIGTMAIQMARAFGARVATTAGTDEKCSFCLGLGAEVAINYRTQDWAAELARWAQPHGIDAILDMIGGDYFPKHIDLLATGGRLVHIATSHGSQVTVDLRSIMMKRLLITGSTLRSRSVAEKSSLARAVEQNLWPLFATGQLRPVIDSVFPLDQAADAHRLMESGRHTGKIIL